MRSPRRGRARHLDAVVETFATDEHRIGLKPILRRVCAPRGARPLAPVITASSGSTSPPSSPATGESFWYLFNGVSKALFEDTLALFARGGGGARAHHHPRARCAASAIEPDLAVPDGISAAVHPGAAACGDPLCLRRRPIVNKHFKTLADLDAAVAAQMRHPRRRTRNLSAARRASTGGQSASFRSDQPEFDQLPPTFPTHRE